MFVNAWLTTLVYKKQYAGAFDNMHGFLGGSFSKKNRPIICVYKCSYWKMMCTACSCMSENLAIYTGGPQHTNLIRFGGEFLCRGSTVAIKHNRENYLPRCMP